MSRIEKLREMLQSNGADSFLEHALALEHIKEGEENEARQLFETLLQREPQYVGSYYHLAKLYERLSQYDSAIDTYKAGMIQAKLANDNHSYNELRAALEDIEE